MVNPEYVEEELSMARQALADADQLVAGNGSDEGVVNRLYYAAFHAAQAALYDLDINPASQSALRNRFGKHLVLEGSVSRTHGRLLTTLADLRQQADYGYEPIDEDVDDLLERTRQFVDDITELIHNETGA